MSATISRSSLTHPTLGTTTHNVSTHTIPSSPQEPSARDTRGEATPTTTRRTAAPESLRTRLARALPPARFSYGWQRNRILDRAQSFETQLRAITGSPREMARLRATMGADFDPRSQISFHGVASHFGPEGLQAHVVDRRGRLHVFVRDGENRWVSRSDLADRVRSGRIPSTDPGRTQRGATATFAIARPDASGRYVIQTPNLSRFEHAPRAQPFAVGSIVQLTRATGQPDGRVEGQPHTSDQDVEFGRITATDGRGRWTVEVTNRDGTPMRGADGRPIRRTVSDADLRRVNNPHILRDGDRVHSDTRFDSRDASQRTMMSQWAASDAYRQLMATRPPAGASADVRARWEESAVRASQAWLGTRMRYPAGDPRPLRTQIAAIDRELARLEPTTERAQQLRSQRDGLNRNLTAALADHTRCRQHAARHAQLTRQISEARAAGRPTAALESSLATNRTEWQQAYRRVTQDRAFHQQLQTRTNPPPTIGEYFVNGTGECRHQAIAQQVLLQQLGIDSRMTRGAANTADGVYRGEHMWLEVTLPNGRILMADPTWSEVGELREMYQQRRDRRERPSDTEAPGPTGYRDSLVRDDTTLRDEVI